jgi:hypothetical protein
MSEAEINNSSLIVFEMPTIQIIFDGWSCS